MSFVISLKPKICFIEGGINDVDAEIAPDSIAANLERMASLLKENRIIPVLMNVTHVADNYPKSAQMNKTIGELNKLIIGVASKNQLQVINLNPKIAPAGKLLPVYTRNDGNHLTSKLILSGKPRSTGCWSYTGYRMAGILLLLRPPIFT
jgi:alpha-glucosidase